MEVPFTASQQKNLLLQYYCFRRQIHKKHHINSDGATSNWLKHVFPHFRQPVPIRLWFWQISHHMLINYPIMRLIFFLFSLKLFKFRIFLHTKHSLEPINQKTPPESREPRWNYRMSVTMLNGMSFLYDPGSEFQEKEKINCGLLWKANC